MSLPKFYLASASPRRRELLSRVGIKFDIIERKHFDERSISIESPAEYAETLARLKAQNAIIPPNPAGIVLGFDTIVYIDDRILGKPANTEEAALFLKKISGRWHTVYTGVAAIKIPEGAIVSSVESTRVLFSELSDAEIDTYVSTGEPMDKAGAYGIQEFGALLVKKIDGCFYNVVGLPLLCLTEVLKQFNIDRIMLLHN